MCSHLTIFCIFKFQRNALFKYFSLFFEVCVGTISKQQYLSNIFLRIKNIGWFQIRSIWKDFFQPSSYQILSDHDILNINEINFDYDFFHLDLHVIFSINHWSLKLLDVFVGILNTIHFVSTCVKAIIQWPDGSKLNARYRIVKIIINRLFEGPYHAFKTIIIYS